MDARCRGGQGAVAAMPDDALRSSCAGPTKRIARRQHDHDDPRRDLPPMMPHPSGFIKPCLPSKVFRPPFGPLWVHEIKHDGYRLMVRRDGPEGPMFHPQSGGRGCSIGEICDLHDLASGVIGGPFADLFSAFEVA